ncbi:transporter [Mannheimia granulomatis]|uniref:Transporter n=1 Tax=Mannheimia granulomatis TaxID=85402 RepID=A0A6G8JFQ6_9PAST|nr:MFS transporter [Mannheimia granulomatis]QIM65909.1 transporter [Mannheimia granulomatis]
MSRSSPLKVAVASMVGTAIEYFDNYIYTMAAVLVFNVQFFNSNDPVSNQLMSLSVLALAFFTRPMGSIIFGHFGDKYGRKQTLIASLLLMGLSTVAIGLLPNYAAIGIWATILLCLCRIGQGLGLGGEWGGAALVATEHAPTHKRAFFGIFPQMGAPIGLLLANGAFYLVNLIYGEQAFLDWAWRIPFIASLVMIFIGLYIRLKISESPIFLKAEQQGKNRYTPLKVLFSRHLKPFTIGVLIATAGYVLFYILVAFTPIFVKSPVAVSKAGYVTGLGLPANLYTQYLLITSVIFGIAIFFSGLYSDKIGRRLLLLIATGATVIYGLTMPFFLENGTPTSIFIFLAIGMILIGLSYGPMAVILPELFPTEVRYTGASLAYTVAGILGASVFTIIAVKINENFGLFGVGGYLSVASLLSFWALWQVHETKDLELTEI